MSSYSELVKNFEKVREIMREFYVYGFKRRGEYDKKSGRSYDDERRRLESWLGDYMKFVRTPEGKNVFISIDSRVSVHNPFYNALKAKSFTDRDITLHFILFDILYDEDKVLTLSEIMDKIDEYLSEFEAPMMVDESTVRKKLKEYINIGIVEAEKAGRSLSYRRAPAVEMNQAEDALNFFSEAVPCGAIGSFLLDKVEKNSENFCFKHHYMTSAIDSEVMVRLFSAMRQKCVVTVTNESRRYKAVRSIRIVPLKIFISVRNGRQYLLAYQPDVNKFKSFRLDYLSEVKTEEATPRFDELRNRLNEMQTKMWGVTVDSLNSNKLKYVEFTVKVSEGEEYIVRRLNREKRIGTVEKIDENTYKFSVETAQVSELIPWIRTYICRINEINFSDKAIEESFKEDIEKLYSMYDV